MSKPTITAFGAFDALLDYEIAFTHSGGIAVGSTLIIRDNATNEIISNTTVTTMALSHLIPAGTLENGKYYNASIRVRYATGTGETEETETSDAVPFRCFKTPTISFSESDGTIVTKSSVYIEATYDQEQAIPMSEMMISVSGVSGDVVWESGAMHMPEGASIPYACGVEITGLSDGESYVITAQAMSSYGMSAVSTLSISVIYEKNTDYQLFSAMNVPERASILLRSNANSLEGTYIGENPVYENGAIDLTNGDCVLFSIDEEATGGNYQVIIEFFRSKSSQTILDMTDSNGVKTTVTYVEAQFDSSEGKRAICMLEESYAGVSMMIMSNAIELPSWDNGDHLILRIIYSGQNRHVYLEKK